MKKFISYGTVVAIVIVGALLNHRNNTLLSLDEKQSLRDAMSIEKPGQMQPADPTQSAEFSAVKPVAFAVLESANICHQIVYVSYFRVYWDADSQKVVVASDVITPILTFKLVQNTSPIVREDQFGGIWEAAGHKIDVSHAFRPLHKGYLLGYVGYNCWLGGKDRLIGMALVTEENEELAKAFDTSTWRSRQDWDQQSSKAMKKHKSLMQRIIEALGNRDKLLLYGL